MSTGPDPAPANRYVVPSVRTAILILQYLKGEGHRRATLAEICKALDISKSSVFTVLKTLQDGDFVRYDASRKSYALGLSLLELGSAVAREMDDTAIARPFVRRLADEIRQTCVIARWIDDKFIFLYCAEPPREVRVTVGQGQQLRYLSGAFGKAYLAYAGDDYVQQVLSKKPLQPFTPHSITDVGRFMRELALCRQNGYAESYEETELGINAIASPVFDKDSNVALLIGFLGFSSSLRPESMRESGLLVREAAASISAALGSTRTPEWSEPQ